MNDTPTHLYIPKAHMEVPIVIPYYATASKPMVAASHPHASCAASLPVTRREKKN
ncbi:hypothetical protein CYLTODRAFT_427240, partial [Cylindrobasidium torrendii FP15055 ss-10]